MAEENAAAAAAPAAEPATDWQAEAARWQAESRKWEERSKANRDKAKAYDELSQAHEALKAESGTAAERIAQLERELGDLKAAGERAETVAAVAAERKVDPELLAMMAGNTAEEIAANAERLAAKVGGMRRYPEVGDQGAVAPAAASRESISKLKGRAQLDAIAKNIGLYKTNG